MSTLPLAYLDKVADVGSALRYARLAIDMALEDVDALRSPDVRVMEATAGLMRPEVALPLAAIKKDADAVKDALMRLTCNLGLPVRPQQEWDPRHIPEPAEEVPGA